MNLSRACSALSGPKQRPAPSHARPCAHGPSSAFYAALIVLSDPSTDGWRRAGGGQLFIACISAEILMVAKLEKVSETAYGRMM